VKELAMEDSRTIRLDVQTLEKMRDAMRVVAKHVTLTLDDHSYESGLEADAVDAKAYALLELLADLCSRQS
jgi:hypothetical protein